MLAKSCFALWYRKPWGQQEQQQQQWTNIDSKSSRSGVEWEISWFLSEVYLKLTSGSHNIWGGESYVWTVLFTERRETAWCGLKSMDRCGQMYGRLTRLTPNSHVHSVPLCSSSVSECSLSLQLSRVCFCEDDIAWRRCAKKSKESRESRE